MIHTFMMHTRDIMGDGGQRFEGQKVRRSEGQKLIPKNLN